MEIKIINQEFWVCKVKDLSQVDYSDEFCFIGKTDEELSLVWKIWYNKFIYGDELFIPKGSFKGEDARLEQEQFMHLEANVLNMNKRKKQWIIFISVVILLTIIISSLVYLLEKQPKEKINVLEFSEDNGDLNYGKTEVEDGFYDNDEKLLSIGDECNYSPRGFEIQKSRIYESFEDLNGFMTLAYFFKYQGKSSVLNFSYNWQITKGKCK